MAGVAMGSAVAPVAQVEGEGRASSIWYEGYTEEEMCGLAQWVTRMKERKRFLVEKRKRSTKLEAPNGKKKGKGPQMAAPTRSS